RLSSLRSLRAGEVRRVGAAVLDEGAAGQPGGSDPGAKPQRRLRDVSLGLLAGAVLARHPAVYRRLAAARRPRSRHRPAGPPRKRPGRSGAGGGFQKTDPYRGIEHHPMKSTSRRRRPVLMVGYTYYESDTRVIREAEAAVEAGYEVDVLALRKADTPAVEMIRGVRVIRLNQ